MSRAQGAHKCALAKESGRHEYQILWLFQNYVEDHHFLCPQSLTDANWIISKLTFEEFSG